MEARWIVTLGKRAGVAVCEPSVSRAVAVCIDVLLLGLAGGRPPLKYDISVDEEPDFDPREHDWRFDLHTHLG